MQVKRVHASTVQLTHLAGQLLTLARLDPDGSHAACDSVDLTQLARSVVTDRERLAEANQIDLGVASTLSVHIQGSGDNLRVLLNNLVDNAIRYAGAHTRCSKSATTDPASPNRHRRVRENAVTAVADTLPPAADWVCPSCGASPSSTTPASRSIPDWKARA